MKKFKATLILAIASLSLAACGSKAGETNSVTSTNTLKHIEVGKYTFHWSNVDPSQVLDIYSKLAKVELTNQQSIPSAQINFSPEKSLTREEAIQAIEKVLREQAGVVFKRVDEKHIALSYDPSVKTK